MKLYRILFLTLLAACANSGNAKGGGPQLYGVDSSQTSRMSEEDVKFFMTGSMSSEFLPERVLRALMMTYPKFFGNDLTAFGAIYEKGEEWPIGFSKRQVEHLGNQVSIGINCASCHVSEVYEAPGARPLRILGRPGVFDIYTFFGVVAVSMVETTKLENMETFLHKYLRAGDPTGEQQKLLSNEWMKQKEAIAKVLADDPFASKDVKPGDLHKIDPKDLELNGKMLHASADLTVLVKAILKVFHNTRTALAIPEKLPPPVPTLPGPGRTDAFGVLAAALFGIQCKVTAPVKYGFCWNLQDRRWVHWDGNMDSPVSRNLGAALGLGTPMTPNDRKGHLVDFALIQRVTEISEKIRAPRYPWKIDEAAASRGARHYEAKCASCHDGPEDKRLYDVGSDPNRVMIFDAEQARLHNQWLAGLQIEGYKARDTYRSTQKYWANDMAGAWARSPYLHNGSVRTMWDLLTPPNQRPKSFKVGSRLYDSKAMGFADDGSFTFDTTQSGNSNAGHNYGTDLSDSEKRDLIEYLKTR